MDDLKVNASLRDIQQYVEQLENERGFASNTVLQKCLLLGEEVGELFKAVRKDHGGMRYDVLTNYSPDAAGEIADILLLLTAVANRLGVDMESAIRQKEAVNKHRSWS
jgi:NTP pyrophosphatase (non-canonical NTP hydrolase)